MELYLQDGAYALEHGEKDKFFTFNKECEKCCQAVNDSIIKHRDYCHFDSTSAVKEVIDEFGINVTNYILANTVQYFNSDGRISRSNKEWAKTIPCIKDGGEYLIIDKVHVTLVNDFVTELRKVPSKNKNKQLMEGKND